jgi:hypothetical protein
MTRREKSRENACMHSFMPAMRLRSRRVAPSHGSSLQQAVTGVKNARDDMKTSGVVAELTET